MNDLRAALKDARVIVEKWCHYQGNTPELFEQYLGPIDAALAAEGAPTRSCNICGRTVSEDRGNGPVGEGSGGDGGNSAAITGTGSALEQSRQPVTPEGESSDLPAPATPKRAETEPKHERRLNVMRRMAKEGYSEKLIESWFKGVGARNILETIMYLDRGNSPVGERASSADQNAVANPPGSGRGGYG